MIAVPDAPGMGLDIDEAVAAAHPIRDAVACDDYWTPEEIVPSRSQ